jgi:hypothetical protein
MISPRRENLVEDMVVVMEELERELAKASNLLIVVQFL